MSRAITAFFLGGTISMTGHGGGVVSRAGAAELVAGVPQLADVDAELTAHNFRQLPSASLGFADVYELVEAARSSGADGVVVVQGTDTLEETAYLIDLLWSSDVPVVLTGAMRNPTLAGPDGPANLLAAVQVAAADTFRGQGALVVFADEVHAARYVRKTHSTSVGTFVSPGAGPIGHVVEGRPVALFSVPRRTAHAPDRSRHPRVPIWSVGLDDDGVFPAAAQDCDGLVVAGLGAGHVPDRLAEPLGALAARMPVVLTTRTGSGPVLSHTYGFTGSETDLLARGVLGGGLLDPYKARVLLSVALACGYSSGRVAEVVLEASGLG